MVDAFRIDTQMMFAKKGTKRPKVLSIPRPGRRGQKRDNKVTVSQLAGILTKGQRGGD